MRKFLIKILLFIGLVLLYKLILFTLIICTFSNKDSNDYLGVSSNKQKIILVGSSNMLYNFNYKLLNDYFINYDVIGCSLSEPSGFFATYYKLKKLRPTKQDIVVFCLPHSLYESEKFLPLKSNKKSGFSIYLLFESLQEFPLKSIESAFFNINIKDIYKIIRTIGFNKSELNNITSFKKTTDIESDSLYKRCWVSDDLNFFVKSDGFDKEYIIKIHTFLNKNINSEILFRYPAIKENDYDIDTDRLSFLDNNFKFINTFDSSVYKKEYWFDQWYHLNKCGRDLNTQKIISELNNIARMYNTE